MESNAFHKGLLNLKSLLEYREDFTMCVDKGDIRLTVSLVSHLVFIIHLAISPSREVRDVEELLVFELLL